LVITLASSLFVALVFNPTVSSSFLKLDEKMRELPGDRLLSWLLVRYENTLKWALKYRAATIGLTLALFILMFIVFVNLNHGIEFFPETEPPQAFIDIEAAIGTRLETSDKMLREVEKRIKDTPDMENYIADVGNVTSIFDFGRSGSSSHKSRVTIDFLDRHLRSQNTFTTLDQLRDEV
ncbi:MAG: hypothetical protein GWN00_04510, partial [Aliifodinibius sp.]|nr:efflux RND transporter permease subunit [Fodinibius sp.]NIV13870.1 hypothetical protein [Fodinibius sp.]NIY24092.1 hypothetical protein [Fodinibius sp.]